MDPDGHHHSVYETNLERLTVSVSEGSYQVDIELEERPVDRMANIWGQLRGEEEA